MVLGIAILSVVLGYLLGSIPSGLILVRIVTGRDIRAEGSGRTGGTNAMRAGGSLVGLSTGILDVIKGILGVSISRWLMPGAYWLDAMTGLAVVLGHNYSIYLLEWAETKIGRLPVLRGGAGGAPTLGVAIAFWWPSIFIVLPIGVAVFFLIGYASVTTLVGGVLVFLIFLLRNIIGFPSAWYAVFGIGAVILLVIALRPNLARLVQGTERMVGLRVWLAKRRKQNPQ
jgi:glycerol-3-phosphate acyltransferase PlsY